MIHPPIDERAPVLEHGSTVVQTFFAVCIDCPDWLGRPRRNNLAALNDFDEHKASGYHRASLAAAREDEPIAD